MKILYHDAHVLLVEKPSGLLSQPGRTIKDCLLSRLQQVYPTVQLLHRLDQATSGIMIFALSNLATKRIATQFQNRTMSKSYQALVYGNMPASEGSISLPLRCDWPNRPRQEVHTEGKKSLTHWRLLELKEGVSRLKLTPITGRSHQLRVHLCALGFPILGDNLYATGEALLKSPRLCLHAQTLGFNHPITNDRLCFESHPEF